MAKQLSAEHCILLTVHFASEGNIKALHSFTPLRPDALSPELVLCILLTYLPEAIEPQEYTTYVREVGSRLYLDTGREDFEADTSAVKDIDDAQAKRRVRKLKLLELRLPDFPTHAPDDLLTRFICHRTYRIDSETGLLNLIPRLVEPFLDRNNFIRTWYIAVILPILRLELEYYPQDKTQPITLAEFERIEGREGIEFLLQHVSNPPPGQRRFENAKTEVTRDIRALVGPWMYGHTERKRRKLEHSGGERKRSAQAELAPGLRKVSLSGVTSSDLTGHDWEHVYRWMVFHARDNFDLITEAIEEWNGPADVDLGGYEPGVTGLYMDDDVQTKLEKQYAQAAFASCYAVTANTEEMIRGAHGILVRLAEILDFIPPPDLASSIESLPKIERHAIALDKSETLADLEPEALLAPNHPLTTPTLETYMLLQMLVYSAYQFSGLRYPISLVNVAKLYFYAAADESLAILRRILHDLLKATPRLDELQWTANRAKLLWLWNWEIEDDGEAANNGAGPLGRVPRNVLEEELLRCFIETNCHNLAINLYLKAPTHLIPSDRIEELVLGKAMEAYDSASNGNKTRGGMKKANDIVAAFQPFFKECLHFRQAVSLIAATHSLSFYSLTLQHGVPFQPVSIRVSSDPIGLIHKVLEQNPRSYTKLDDLIEIGRNLVSAGLRHDENRHVSKENESVNPKESLEKQRKDAERRVSFMAIEAALHEDDFETAYSYIVNRLTPTGRDMTNPPSTKARHKRNISSITSTNKFIDEDDISWRAAFLAGRYRPSTVASNSTAASLRRLEQRTELLSLALLLAPTSALTEVLAAWRRCEEETSALQLSQQQADEAFDDRADKRLSSSALPGNFTVSDQDTQPALLLNQQRREMGRMSGRTGGRQNNHDDSPVSMFDLTRNAARAFSSSSWSAKTGSEGQGGNAAPPGATAGFVSDADGPQRVRKRDMVANAASGALASGLGWVLGATPAGGQQQPQQHE